MAAPKGHPNWGGRPKGRRNEKTLDLLWERELLRKQILARRGPMTDAQMNHAEGIWYMVLRNPDGSFTRATNEDQVNAAIAAGSHTFKLYTQAPNPQAFSTLMAYAVDRPKEQPQDINLKADVNILDILRQRHARSRKTE